MSGSPRVLQVSAELFPFVKTGGLADVCAALPPALQAAGADVRLLLPGFAPLRDALQNAERLPGSPVLSGSLPGGLRAYVLDLPELYDRPGPLYGHSDDALRFARLGQVAAALASGLDRHWRAELVHAHDWHAGLACAHLAWARSCALTSARSVYTVHNLAYQGLFPAQQMPQLGLPAPFFAVQGLEFYGQVSFMKAGLQFADALSTVSPSYAQEIQTLEQGCGLDGLLRERSGVLHGILNGVDDSVWNPALDGALVKRYRAGQWAAKAECKAALQAEHGLHLQADQPLLGVVSRLTEQKGLPLILASLDALLAGGAQLLVLGSGDTTLQLGFAEAAQRHPGRVVLAQGFDEALAHRIVAGCDALLVPSRFEPCGLTQLYALAYGSLPLVRRVGGLADTVVDCTLEDLDADQATGFVFERFERADYERALRRLFALWAKPVLWRQVQRRAMAQRFGWDTAAAQYLAVYRGLLQ